MQQSHQLASALSTISPPIAHIYSSPYYRCLETILPTAQKLGLEIRADNGVGSVSNAPFMHFQDHELMFTYSENGTVALPSSNPPPHRPLSSILSSQLSQEHIRPPASLQVTENRSLSYMTDAHSRSREVSATRIENREMRRLRS